AGANLDHVAGSSQVGKILVEYDLHVHRLELPLSVSPRLEEIPQVVRFRAGGLEPPEVDPHIEDARDADERSHYRLREHHKINDAAHDRRDRERLKIESDNRQ